MLIVLWIKVVYCYKKQKILNLLAYNAYFSWLFYAEILFESDQRDSFINI